MRTITTSLVYIRPVLSPEVSAKGAWIVPESLTFQSTFSPWQVERWPIPARREMRGPSDLARSPYLPPNLPDSRDDFFEHTCMGRWPDNSRSTLVTFLLIFLLFPLMAWFCVWVMRG